MMALLCKDAGAEDAGVEDDGSGILIFVSEDVGKKQNDQTATNAEDVGQEAQTTTDQTATNAEDVGQEAQTTTDQTTTNAEDVGQEVKPPQTKQ